MRGKADGLVVVGQIEFGSIGSPRGVLNHAVDFAHARRRQAECDNLSNPHLDIPALDFDPRRRESLIETLSGELGVEFAEGTRLIVAQEDGEQDGVVGRRRGGTGRRGRGRLRVSRRSRSPGPQRGDRVWRPCRCLWNSRRVDARLPISSENQLVCIRFR